MKLSSDKEVEAKYAKAAARGLEFTLTSKNLDMLYSAKYCVYTGVKFYKNKGQDYKLSIERINSNIGYVPGNVIPVTVKANELKSNFSLDELKKDLDRRITRKQNLQKNLDSIKNKTSLMKEALNFSEEIGRMYKNIYILEQVINSLETKDLYKEAQKYMTWWQRFTELGA